MINKYNEETELIRSIPYASMELSQ
jgi:hypothetical protein